MVNRRGLLAAVLIATFLLALASGCGEKTDVTSTQPDTTPATTPTVPVEEASVKVYLLVGETPAPLTRMVKGGAREALEQLLGGPTPAEEEQGYATAIPQGTRLNSYTVEGETATADFSRELLEYGGGSAMVQAITAQITETVKANDPRVKNVVITVDGVPAEEALQP